MVATFIEFNCTFIIVKSSNGAHQTFAVGLAGLERASHSCKSNRKLTVFYLFHLHQVYHVLCDPNERLLAQMVDRKIAFPSTNNFETCNMTQILPSEDKYHQALGRLAVKSLTKIC